MKEIKSRTQAATALICPVCGKEAFRRENGRAGIAYLHLTKKGPMRHFLEADKPGTKTKRKKATA